MDINVEEVFDLKVLAKFYCEEKLINKCDYIIRTRISRSDYIYFDQLVETVSAQLSGLKSVNQYQEMIADFIVRPVVTKKKVFGSDTERGVYRMPNNQTLILSQGDLTGNPLTFTKLSAVLGYKNRNARQESYRLRPQFAEDITLEGKTGPKDFVLFLYRGVHLEFDVSNRKLTIYLAIMAMDLCMANHKRLKDRSGFLSAKEMVDSILVQERPFYCDLIGHSSVKRIAAFERQNREKIDKYLPMIKFIFKKKIKN